MTDYLQVFAEAAVSAPRHRLSRDLPLVVISAGDQPDDVMAAHRALAESSARGRHIVASGSGHWIPFDDPELIVNAVRELIGGVRR
jgi:pimeloyl-ACP methyl ester carboxylesterase